MSFGELLFFAVIACAGAWHYPGLRMLALVILMSVMVIPFTDDMPKLGRVWIFAPIDLIWGFVAFHAWRTQAERLGLFFLCVGLVQMIAHFGFAINPTAIAGWNYIAFLNMSFVGSCLILGGTGFVRNHAHLFDGRGGDHAHTAARKGG